MDNKTEPIRLEEEGGRAPTPLAGSVLYLLVLLLMMLNSIVSQRIRPTGNFYYIYMLLVQIATIGLPSFLYLIIHRMVSANCSEVMDLPSTASTMVTASFRRNL